MALLAFQIDRAVAIFVYGLVVSFFVCLAVALALAVVTFALWCCGRYTKLQLETEETRHNLLHKRCDRV